MNFKYHILIASFILSFLLWLSLNLNLTYDLDYSVPIKINVNKPLAVANVIPLTLNVKVKGRGWSLIRLYTSLNLEFNYDIDSRKNQHVILTNQYLGEKFDLSENLHVIYVDPETLVVNLDRYAEKYVKVEPYVIVDCKDGYQVVGKPVLEPDSIKIGGAIGLLRDINKLHTKKLYYKNINSNISETVKLTDSLSNIIWKSQDEVKMNINVELTAVKEFHEVEIKVSNTPADKEVMLIPQNAALQVKGGVKQLAELDNSKILASIDFIDLLKDTTGAVTPKYFLPEGIKIISSKPEKIQYIIKKKY
jgi:YbbR domain-containing protein